MSFRRSIIPLDAITNMFSLYLILYPVVSSTFLKVFKMPRTDKMGTVKVNIKQQSVRKTKSIILVILYAVILANHKRKMQNTHTESDCLPPSLFYWHYFP